MEARRNKYVVRTVFSMIALALPMSVCLCFLFVPESVAGAEKRFNALWSFRTLFFFYGLIFSTGTGMNLSTYGFSRFVSYGATRKQAYCLSRKFLLVSVGVLILSAILFDMITGVYGGDFITDLLLITAGGCLALCFSFALSVLAIRYQKTGYSIALPIILIVSLSIMFSFLFFCYEIFEIAGRNRWIVFSAILIFAGLSLALNRKRESMLERMDIASWIV